MSCMSAPGKRGPCVSVVMPTFNHELFIAQAMRSVLDQYTTFDIELIVGDDCSTDRTREIVQELASLHRDRVTVVLQETNLGPGRNCASLLAKCRGDYIAMLEGDDFWGDSSKLERQVTFMREHPGCTVSHHRVVHFDQAHGREIGEFPEERFRHVRLEGMALAECNFLRTCSVMFRRDAMPDLDQEFWALKMQDWPLVVLLAERGWIGYIDRPMATYRIHSTSWWTPLSRARKLEAELDVGRYLLRRLSSEARRPWVDRFFYQTYAERPARTFPGRLVGLVRNTVMVDARLAGTIAHAIFDKIRSK